MMADIEARREARIKRILQNSEGRLRKITGVEQKADINNIDGYVIKTSEIKDSLNLNNLISDVRLTNAAAPVNNSPINEVQTLFRNPNNFSSTSVVPNSLNVNQEGVNFNVKRLVLVGLAALLSLILLVDKKYNNNKDFSDNSVVLNKIFVPLLAYELILFFFNEDGNNSSFLSPVLMLLLATRRNFLAPYMKYVNFFVKFMQDLMIFFFVFIITYNVFKFLV